jgi:gold/copper resistance efflux pump
MHLFGFSLNTLSLFGLVLSIGIVVDDAIVVVENVERHIARPGIAGNAGLKAMEEVTGPILAITLSAGGCLHPFSISVRAARSSTAVVPDNAISTILSAINSLTLSPALAAAKPHHGPPQACDRLTRIIDGLFGGFFRRFNSFFDRASGAYVGMVRRAVRGSSAIVLMLYVGFLG